LREPDEYIGCATDENWLTFDDHEPSATVSDSLSPQVTMPQAGATVPFAQKVVIAWNQDANDPGMSLGDVTHTGPGCNNCCPEWNTGALTVMHLPAISGNVYDLQFSTGGSVTHRVVTTIQEWTPTDALWASWRGQAVSLKIYRMTVIANDVRPGVGGPFVGTQPFTFRVGS
jgi:hypothetical protein